MFSIQQLAPLLRKLQNNVCSGHEYLNLFKRTNIKSTVQEQAESITTVSLAERNVTSPKSLKQNIKKYEQKFKISSQQTRMNTNAYIYVSRLLPLNEHSCILSLSATNTAQNRNIRYIQGTQNTQIFNQKQLHSFHIKRHLNIYKCLTSTKQTNFAMSSFSAEPLSIKQQQDINIIGSICEDDNVNKVVPESIRKPNNLSITSKTSASVVSSEPCVKNGLGEILKFMELIGNLKHTKRTGWVLRDVKDCESISAHMYRMSMLTFLLDGSEGLNQIRCMELALVHDLAESLVGDITPFCGISKEEKRIMEFQAMEDICKLIQPRGERIMVLFEEYELGESPESKFVKDLDRLDMIMQAFEYEKRDNCLLKHQEFFDSTEGKFNHPFIKELVGEIYEQRRGLAKAKDAHETMDSPLSKVSTNGNHIASVASHENSDIASSS